MNAEEMAAALRHLVADTVLKLDQDLDRQYLLEDLMVRLGDLAALRSGLQGPEPVFPLIPDAVERLARERT
jgi:hypothetical protein